MKLIIVLLNLLLIFQKKNFKLNPEILVMPLTNNVSIIEYFFIIAVIPSKSTREV
jgi:hypothetical protein